jgi:hypothetical protein
MSPTPLVNHTCSYFCHNGRHALEVLALPTLSRALLWEWLVKLWAPYEWQVVELAPARECDVRTWSTRMTVEASLLPQTAWTAVTERACPADMVGWVMWVAPREEQDDG